MCLFGLFQESLRARGVALDQEPRRLDEQRSLGLWLLTPACIVDEHLGQSIHFTTLLIDRANTIPEPFVIRKFLSRALQVVQDFAESAELFACLYQLEHDGNQVVATFQSEQATISLDRIAGVAVSFGQNCQA